MRRRASIDSPEMPIAPMIDCVFLMLVYFMTTSSLERSEADLDFPLASQGIASDPLPNVDEQVLEVSEAGEVLWNGSVFAVLRATAEQRRLDARLVAFRKACELARSEPSMRILPTPLAPHQGIVYLLDAAVRSGIEQVSFSDP